MGKRFATVLACAFVAVLLCLGLMPATALAAAPSGQVIYVGNVNVTSGGYWTTGNDGTVTAFTGEGTPADNFIHYDATNNVLTLHNAAIKKGLDYSESIQAGTYIFGSAIGVFNQNGAAELTIRLGGSNAIENVSTGIYVLASSNSTGDASLTITGSGSLNANGSQYGIRVQSNSGGATLEINSAEVKAVGGTYTSCSGVLVQAKNDSDVSLTVDGGNLTASGNTGISFWFGTGYSGSGTPSLAVSGNAIVRANSGISDNSSTDIQIGADSSGNTGGIVFNGNEGTVYGDVTLQENITINEGESLTIPEGSSLAIPDNKTLTVNGGELTGNVPQSGVVYKVTEVTLDKSNLTLDVGESETLTVTITPDNATDKSVTWESSASGVATVDTSGKVTAVAQGTATITATAADGSGEKATCSVTVNTAAAVPVEGLSLNKTELTLTEGGSETLTATITPADATNQKVTWSSSDSKVATVDANGKVTAVGAGTAAITVTTADGSKNATCTVTVEHDLDGAWSSDESGHWHACEACGDELDYAAHEPEIVGKQDATCTEDGYTGDTVCSVCGYVIAKGAAIPATGHTYKDGVCDTCGAKDPDYVAPKKPEPAGEKDDSAIPATGDATTLFSAVPALAGATAVAAGAVLRRRR